MVEPFRGCGGGCGEGEGGAGGEVEGNRGWGEVAEEGEGRGGGEVGAEVGEKGGGAGGGRRRSEGDVGEIDVRAVVGGEGDGARPESHGVGGSSGYGSGMYCGGGSWAVVEVVVEVKLWWLWWLARWFGGERVVTRRERREQTRLVKAVGAASDRQCKWRAQSLVELTAELAMAYSLPADSVFYSTRYRLKLLVLSS